MIEEDLSALALQQAVSIWKLILTTVLFVFCYIFPDSVGQLAGAGDGQITLAIHNMNEDKRLYWLMIGVMFFNALSANLGMQIVKAENAVFKQSVILLPVPILWVYHMAYGDQKDNFSVFKLISQILMVGAIVMFLWADRTAVADAQKLIKYKKHDYAPDGHERHTSQGDTQANDRDDDEDPYAQDEDQRCLMQLPTQDFDN